MPAFRRRVLLALGAGCALLGLAAVSTPRIVAGEIPPRAVALAVDSVSPVRELELPDRHTSAPVVLATIKGGDFDVQVLSPPGNPLQFQVSTSDSSTWSISDAKERRPVATVALVKDELQFVWAKDVSEKAECLRNSVLALSGGKAPRQYVPLRTSRLVDSPLIDLGKQEQRFPIEANLWGLKRDTLQVEVLGLSSPDVRVKTFVPGHRRATSKESVRMIYRDEPFGARVTLTLAPSKTDCVLRVQHTVFDKNMPLTPARVDNMRKKTAKDIRSIKNDLDEANDDRNALSKQRQVLIQKRYLPNKAAIRENNTAKDETNQALKETELKIDRLKNELQEFNNRMEDLNGLFDLANKVNKLVPLECRVFYEVENYQVNLLVYRSPDPKLRQNAALGPLDRGRSPFEATDALLGHRRNRMLEWHAD